MVPGEKILIADPRVLTIPIEDEGEPLVDLLEGRSIFVDESRQNVQKISGTISLIRKSVAGRLQQVQDSLPAGIRLKIKEGYRPIQVQRKIFENYTNKLRSLHPEWSEVEVRLEASKFVAPPEIIPPHSTGGAVDLTLMYGNDRELDMGTAVNDSVANLNGATFTLADKISETAKRNRQILIDAMSAAGFVNYPTEWWHWSYGDRYWAYHAKHPFAPFGAARNN